jgi:hypothetical protein
MKVTWYKLFEGPYQEHYGYPVWISDGEHVHIDFEFDSNWDERIHHLIKWAVIDFPEPYNMKEMGEY